MYQKCGKLRRRRASLWRTPASKGLNLLSAPGNDLVAATALASAVRMPHGTVYDRPRNTVRTCSRTDHEDFHQLHPRQEQTGLIDFNAGASLKTNRWKKTCERFIDYIIRVASGEFVNNEKKGYKEIAIFKTGVTL